MVIGGSMQRMPAKPYNDGSLIIIRYRNVVGPDGEDIVIGSDEELQALLDSMTQEQRDHFNMNYRFAPIESNVDSLSYAGTLKDIL